jgi:hypothetical protein
MAISDNFLPRSRPEKFRREMVTLAEVRNETVPGNFGFAEIQTPPGGSSGANDLCMPICEVCQNDYDKAFEVVVGGERHTFDSFECAIHALAPVCPHCNCRIVGHGVEAAGKIFCCVHCARASGTTQLKDRV